MNLPRRRHTRAQQLTPFCTLLLKSRCPSHGDRSTRYTHTHTQQKIKSNQRRKANKERKFCAELLAGHRKRSGLIKPSLCTPVSLNIRMLRTSTLFTLYAAQSESVLCQGKERERERNRKGQRREGGRGILQVAGTTSSQDDTGVAHLTSLLRLSLLYENIHEK